jgi:hypothetical protein
MVQQMENKNKPDKISASYIRHETHNLPAGYIRHETHNLPAGYRQ